MLENIIIVKAGHIRRFLLYNIIAIVLLAGAAANVYALSGETFQRKGKYYVEFSDGKVLGPYDYAGQPIFSSDRSKWVFSYQKSNKGFVHFSSGKILGPYGLSFHAFTPVISADGSTWGFAHGVNQKRKVLFSTGEVFGPYYYALSPSFSANGSRWGYAYGELAKGAKGTKWFARFSGDKKVYGPYDDMSRPEFNSSGSAWGFKYRIGNSKTGKYYVQLNKGKKYGPYDHVWNLSFNKERTHWNFMYRTGDSSRGKFYFRFSNGRVHGPFSSREIPSFNYDGSNWGRVKKKSWRRFVEFSNGTVYGPFEKANAPVFSTDGKKWGFIYVIEDTDLDSLVKGDSSLKIRRNTKTISLIQFSDGRKTIPHDEILWLSFNKDGSRWAYLYKWRGKKYIRFSNKQAYGPYHMMQKPRFDPGGRTVTYGHIKVKGGPFEERTIKIDK